MARTKFDRRKQKTKELEDHLAPSEIATILERDADLPFTIGPLLASGETPVGYVREAWSDDAIYYTANKGARSLIVAFCAFGHGFGVPTAYFLQMLRDDLYDVLVLFDRRKLHFDGGIAGFSESLTETVRLVDAFARERGFDEVITFGASMGGFAALRAGLLLGAKRAISVGGVYCWHVAPLLKNKGTVRAFDVLCPCFADRDVELVTVTPANHAVDMSDLATLRQSFPSLHTVTIDTERHNIMGYFYRARLLRLFCACLFEYWRSDIGAELLALLNGVARYGSSVEASSAQGVMRLRNDKRELMQELKAVHASRSWRSTQPLRTLVTALRRFSLWPSAPGK
jgi:pimeloyl-ACP methyl ester carboxylesterase